MRKENLRFAKKINDKIKLLEVPLQEGLFWNYGSVREHQLPYSVRE
jgi:hypothetical protein